jgi:hypothetical protein
MDGGLLASVLSGAGIDLARDAQCVGLRVEERGAFEGQVQSEL